MDNPLLSPAVASLRMPGATLMTRLRVYDTVAPDDQRSGTPHFHLMCTEMYLVLAGSGAVEMIDVGGFSRVDLTLHNALVFSPGTIHRLINPHGDLEILVIMANAGLPERGDNIVCFADEWLADDARFAEAMKIDGLDAAYRRRDRGVDGFLKLKAAFAESATTGRAALERVYVQAAARTVGQRADWTEIIRAGALDEATRSLNHLEALANLQIDSLFNARHVKIDAASQTKPGFCGHLSQYADPATLHLEGINQP